MENKVIDLGWCMARLQKNAYGTNDLKLTIVSPSDSDESGFTPSESVVIFGTDKLIKLRDFLIESLES